MLLKQRKLLKTTFSHCLIGKQQPYRLQSSGSGGNAMPGFQTMATATKQPQSSDQPTLPSYSTRLKRIPLHFFCAVPDSEIWTVERFGKFYRELSGGFHMLVPLVDRVAYKHSKKEELVELRKQQATTRDSVCVTFESLLFMVTENANKAAYVVDQPYRAVYNLAQAIISKEIGKVLLDTLFSQTQTLNSNIVNALNEDIGKWGIKITRFEMKYLEIPSQIRDAMEMEAEMERKKRKTLLESEAEQIAQEKIAQGKKIAIELVSSADLIERMNIAKGEAHAITTRAEAVAQAIKIIGEALYHANGEKALAFQIAEDYIQQLGKITKGSTTLIVPANLNDTNAVVSSALTLLEKLKNNTDKSDAIQVAPTEDATKK